MSDATSPPAPGGHPVPTLPLTQSLTGRWVLDPVHSSATFEEKHFWSLVTVRGAFERLEGEGEVTPEGVIRGRIAIEAASLTTKNAKRDTHLRSPEFFDAESHPLVTITVDQASFESENRLAVRGELEVAGHSQPLSYAANVTEVAAGSVLLQATLTFDRTQFDMDWSPLHLASRRDTVTVAARFDRVAG